VRGNAQSFRTACADAGRPSQAKARLAIVLPYDPAAKFQEYARPEMIVTTEWVAAHLDDPGLVVAESDKDVLLYETGHIPGAVKLDWHTELTDPVTRDYIGGPAFARLMSDKGITRDTTLVLYGGKNNWWAAYVLWVCSLFGHPDLRLMDGGRGKWMAEGRPLSTDTPKRPQAAYPVVDRDDQHIRAFRDQVVAHLGLPLIDVRSPGEYTGDLFHVPDAPQEGALPGGHIPGAKNVPWIRAVAEDGTFRTRAELEAIYAGEAGLRPDDDVIVYCRIGERSSHTWFVLHHLLGYPHVRNYDRSWTEWSNSVDQLYAEYQRIAAEQAALRRVATLVARASPPQEVFAAVAEEVGRLLAARFAVLVRYDPSDTIVFAGTWTSTGTPAPTPAGGRLPLGGRNVATLVYRTGRPARFDYDDDVGVIGRFATRDLGLRSSVGVPVSVEGRLWGVIIVAFTHQERLPTDAEARLAGFTELVATAIANAEVQAEVIASRARIVAAADQARRRIEQDLHDGAQQRLVSLALQLHEARAAVPPELSKLSADLERVESGLTDALDELREIARGIHPAMLADSGLRAALKALTRRSPIPVDLHVHADERLPEPVEVSAYYVIAEALTNAAKHARSTAVSVDVEDAGDVLRIAVRDDGVGGADLTGGTGLAGLKDRVEALGGRIFLDSPIGAGTSLRAEFPLSAMNRDVTTC
jgi:thiosulfate/3-mercaptopyruvate sulfurtransferase